jgi:hypothetical protein
VAVATLDAGAARCSSAAPGNIAGRLISGIGDRSLLSQHGTVGLQIRRLQDMPYAVAAHAILGAAFGRTARRAGPWPSVGGLLQCHPVVIAGWLIRDHLRGRDDATVVVVRRR